VTPILMKKNRPGQTLSVLCKEEDAEGIEGVLFGETSTLGIRKYAVERNELDRRFESVPTPYGEVNLKLAYREGRLLKFAPEYEDCHEIALQTGIPLLQVYHSALLEGEKRFGGSR
jgi:pyridinium-3,5-bisthiocarboxylic acid mononucleotide nickel chelatase